MKRLFLCLGPEGSCWVLSFGDAKINLVSPAGLHPGRFRGGLERLLVDEISSLFPPHARTWRLLTKWPTWESLGDKFPARPCTEEGCQKSSWSICLSRRKQRLSPSPLLIWVNPSCSELRSTPADQSSHMWEQPSFLHQKRSLMGVSLPCPMWVCAPCSGGWDFLSSFFLSDGLA